MEIEDETGEIAIGIQTDDQRTLQTEIVTGKLDTLILKSNQKVSVIIESELGYIIFHIKEFQGVHYFAPRARALPMLSDAKRVDDIPNMVKFNLNERLNITIIGPKNTNVDLLLRFS